MGEWFNLTGDARLGACTTEGCGGQPTKRLEAGGVGSNYCSGCAAKIVAISTTPAPDGGEAVFISRAFDPMTADGFKPASSEDAPPTVPGEVTDEMILAGCRATHPELFRSGLADNPKDGPATKATRAGIVKSVTAVLAAVLTEDHPHD